jgi:pimeloyl-ACP methyl ester carboxylesterase
MLFALGAGAGVLGGTLAARYRADKSRTMTLLLAGSHLADTKCGRVEYASVGDGPAVLVSPGAGGGYDQSLYVAALFRRSGYRFICVSRPGFLRTPLSTGRTPEEQADAYAALLDALEISRVAVLAVSAGAPAALQFALRHPNRCLGLVLASAGRRPVLAPPATRGAQRILLSNDFFPWLLSRGLERAVFSWSGVGPDLLERVRRDPEKMGLLRGLLHGGITASLRRSGMLNDLAHSDGLSDTALEQLTVPLMVIHSPTDPIVPYAEAARIAQKVPEARLIEVQEGGHLCLITQREEIVPQVIDFFDRHVP